MRTPTIFTSLSALALALFVSACALSELEDAAAPDQAPAGATPQIAQTRPDWEAAMRALALPKAGCFQSDFPRVEWKEVACAARSPVVPYPPTPGGGGHAQQVGGGTVDFAAIPAGGIRAAEGSFDGVSGVTSIDSAPSGGVSEFSLQLNTQRFITPACGGSPNPACRGWQQFVFSNQGNAVVQYWLIRYNTACPAGWFTFMFPPPSTDIYCYKNGANEIAVGHQAIANLINLKLGAEAVLGGNDTLKMWTGGPMMAATNPDNELTLASAWTDAEFNIFGDAYGSEAAFNAGSTVTVRTTVHNGTMDAPMCAMESFTGETNSLTLIDAPVLAGPLPSPGIVFRESNLAGGMASCARARGIGDPHLRTFRGLHYDFQASGDFLLAQRGPDFEVQTRQASGAPTWPNAAVNKAVATRMGKTIVGICQGRLQINGKTTSLADGGILPLPGATVSRQGNAYLIRGDTGDSVRATLNTGYIDVDVGVGRWPDTVLGLLGNGRNASEMVTRDGTVLKVPLTFQEMYGKFGDSWRVPAADSILCTDKQAEMRNPEKPFCVADLAPAVRERAQGVCLQFGVKQGPLLDACVLDVAVLGDGAAQAFVNAEPPVLVGTPGCK